MAEKPPIIIKKIKKVSGGHHGGAWKVAYADFVTAMMAFFLLLWLLNATTEEQKEGIANYFDPVSLSRSSSGSGGMMGGLSLQTETGTMQSTRSKMQIDQVQGVRPTSENEKPQNPKNETKKLSDHEEKELREELEKREEERFKKAEELIKKIVSEDPDLKGLLDNLIIEQTPEGMRIQIADLSQKEMFASGSARMYDHTIKLLQQVNKVIKTLPNQLEINGHTDSKPYKNFKSYSNWELSTKRANTSRRVLVEDGLPFERVESVTGRADKQPLKPENPEAPINRRISLILLKDSILKEKYKNAGLTYTQKTIEQQQKMSVDALKKMDSLF